MRKFVFVLVMLTTLAAVVACATPTAPPAEKVTVKETVIVAGTPQVVEKVITATPAPVPTKAAQPKTLVVCQAQEPDTLYWGATSMLAASNVMEAAVYDGPIDNLNYDYQPVILEKLPNIKDGDAKVTKVKVKAGDTIFDVAKDAIVKADKDMELDQIQVTFKLKAGLKWSDGQPLKASDSLFSFNVQKDKDSGIPSRFLVDRTADYKAPDDRTVVWTGLPGFMYSTYYTAFFTPLPEHVLKGVAPKDIKSHAYARKPVGFGPFRVTQWVSGDRIELEKNPNYWRAGFPKIDKLIYRFIPDTNQLVAQLIAGQCDIGTQDGMSTDQIPFLDQAEKSGLIKPYYIAGTVWEHIDFNANPKSAPKPRPDFFSDPRVRAAVAHGTNRKEMVDKVLYGKTKVIDTFIPAEHWAFPKEAGIVSTYPFDVKKAEELLDAAGWVKGADGVRAKAGQRFSVSISTTSGNKMREQTMQIFQANMKTIGIEVKLDFAPSTVLFARGKEDVYLVGNFDLIMFAWLTGVEVPVNLYRCDQIPTKDNAWAGQNNTLWCNADYDKAATGYFNNLERDVRIKFAHEAQKILTKELPILPLFQRIKVHATNTRVLNFKPDPTQNTELWNIEEIDVK
jgi:peptide/nickel transport system substrate-binding protein